MVRGHLRIPRCVPPRGAPTRTIERPSQVQGSHRGLADRKGAQMPVCLCRCARCICVHACKCAHVHICACGEQVCACVQIGVLVFVYVCARDLFPDPGTTIFADYSYSKSHSRRVRTGARGQGTCLYLPSCTLAL